MLLGKIFEVTKTSPSVKETVSRQKRKFSRKKKTKKLSKKTLLIFSVVVLASLTVRLFFLFRFEDPENTHPGWYEDAYHHWQVAYLSWKIGFKHGFLRLWDLKGMEYFWGSLHPLILGGLMRLAGTNSIVVARLLSLVCGAFNVGFLYLLVKRYFGKQAGLAAAAIAAFNPVGIYSDTSGMQEPLGILMLFLGVFFWPKKAVLTGFFWMLAGMVRAEYWLMAIGLMLLLLIVRVGLEKKLFAWLGFVSLMGLYMKHLLDRTGNAIYPMYWNFLGNMKGKWQANLPPNSAQLLAQKIYIGVLGAMVLFGIWLMIKRPKFLPFFAIGVGNWTILGLTVGLSKYLLSYMTRFWVDRIMILPYMFLAVWFSAVIFKFLGKRWFFSLIGWLLVLGLISATQFLWRPIWYWRGMTEGQWESKVALAEGVSQYYEGGRVLFFENHPASTYWLVYHEGIEGDKIIGQMFDPYFYMEGDPYDNWGENREIVLDWLKKEDIRLMAFLGDRERYLRLVEKEPKFFERLGFDPRWNLYLYQINLNEWPSQES
ncbi:MAG: glycosyltransferase family 39 protein [Candidatus Pacebacteria bacterium]|nr:glycosyltransferase family 39 protein [Candidatus Paceibacterota bacterium]